MSDRVLRRLIGIVAVALVAVVATGSVLGSRTVATDLTRRSETALSAAGLQDVGVSFDGREARLRGGNDIQSRLAAALVETLPGVRQVAVARDREPVLPGVARLELDRAGDDVEIAGVVPSPDAAATVKVDAASSLRATVTGDVEVDRSVGAAEWVDALPDVLDVVAVVEGLELDIPGDGTVRLGGSVADAGTRSSIVQQVERALPGLRLDAALTVATVRGGA